MQEETIKNLEKYLESDEPTKQIISLMCENLIRDYRELKREHVKIVGEHARLLESDGDEIIYYEFYQRDCDLHESTTARMIQGYRNYLLQQDYEYENAEGPIGFYEIDKDGYEKHKPYSRDIAAEMMGY